MIHQLLIVTGADRTGIVGAVSGLLAQNKINLEDLRMSILEGEFAMMVVVSIPNKKIQTLLDQSLRLLENKWKLRIFQCSMGSLEKLRASQRKLSRGTPWVIRVLGKDKQGIVASISQTLAKYQCNITDLQCRIVGQGSKTLYTMVLECVIPNKAKPLPIQRSLGKLAKRLGVEIQIQPSDIIQF